ncbi:hypothetical protein PMG11_09280 [Penicillium brasilianum]|uniref:Uncharacterized protein n=1 Tax=Penicillium brasilianum TaxID=104259 RepID=A0A0F7U0B3_PENBI|nr:hypothetical protein PMG11_09280 [Penicillium brasilianum]
MAATALSSNEGTNFQTISLTDYNTGSNYSGMLWGGLNACTTSECPIRFHETSAGGYTFNAKMWRTSNGCHNIDFEGALDAHHVYCCGSLPRDFTA